jgi:competence ComEA-like helix-hairpin-helix protein
MQRERHLQGCLAGLMLLLAYRVMAAPAPPRRLLCAAKDIGREGDLVVCGGQAPLTGGESRVLGLPLDLNRATELELEALPGVGPTLAERILRARDARGGFRRAEDLLDVTGMGPGKLQALRERVTVGMLRP